jgi:hypothetical protein
MSRALKLLQRLNHFGEPEVNEHTPQEDGQDCSNGGVSAAMLQKQAQQDDDTGPPTTMVAPDSPFNKNTRNPDGTPKVDPGDQAINNSGRRNRTRGNSAAYRRPY